MKRVLLTALMLFLLFFTCEGLSVSAAGSLELLAEEIPEILEITPKAETPVTEIEAAKQELAPKWSANFTKKDLRYLSCIIYAEAGYMSYDARVAVGNVVLNRMRDTKGWDHVNTIKEVIYDRKWGVQFSPTVDGNMDKALKIYDNLDSYKNSYQYDAMKESISIAKLVMRGLKVIPDDFMYFNGHVEKNLKKFREQDRDFRIFDGLKGHIYY